MICCVEAAARFLPSAAVAHSGERTSLQSAGCKAQSVCSDLELQSPAESCAEVGQQGALRAARHSRQAGKRSKREVAGNSGREERRPSITAGEPHRRTSQCAIAHTAAQQVPAMRQGRRRGPQEDPVLRGRLHPPLEGKPQRVQQLRRRCRGSAEQAVPSQTARHCVCPPGKFWAQFAAGRQQQEACVRQKT